MSVDVVALCRVRRQRGVHRLRRRRIFVTTDLSNAAVCLRESPPGQRSRFACHYGRLHYNVWSTPAIA